MPLTPEQQPSQQPKENPFPWQEAPIPELNRRPTEKPKRHVELTDDGELAEPLEDEESIKTLEALLENVVNLYYDDSQPLNKAVVTWVSLTQDWLKHHANYSESRAKALIPRYTGLIAFGLLIIINRLTELEARTGNLAKTGAAGVLVVSAILVFFESFDTAGLSKRKRDKGWVKFTEDNLDSLAATLGHDYGIRTKPKQLRQTGIKAVKIINRHERAITEKQKAKVDHEQKLRRGRALINGD